MPQVIRGSGLSDSLPHLPHLRTQSASGSSNAALTTPTSPSRPSRVTFDQVREDTSSSLPTAQTFSPRRSESRRRHSSHFRRSRDSRRDHEDLERDGDGFYDSRAATQREYRRRGSTLQSYYVEHPELLPQLPFTFRHGFKRWKLAGYIALMVFDACVVPILLYYAMTFGGNVQGWITFAVITAIWGGPTYVEFAVRSLRLIKKEHFFKPLGVNRRWAFDITNWILVLTIAAVTSLLIVGAAPHIVFLRVLSMPGPAILYCLTGPIFLLTLYSTFGWKAPFQISSTAKGEKVLPGIYYIAEDIVAVNAGGGRPFREGWAARYNASPLFRKMLRDQSWFWSIPGLVVAIACTVVVVIHPVDKSVSYGIGWGVPFLWAIVWAAITVPWVRATMAKERREWEEDTAAMADVKRKDAPPAVAPGPLQEKASDESTMRGSVLGGDGVGEHREDDEEQIPEEQRKIAHTDGEPPSRPSDGTTL